MDNRDKVMLGEHATIGSLRYSKIVLQKVIEKQNKEIKTYRRVIAICLVFTTISITISIVRVFS